MNRAYQEGRGYLECGVVELFARVTIGASGAVTATAYAKGITSIARTAAGKYLVTLEDPYNTLLFAGAVEVSSADPNPTTSGVLARIDSDDVTNSTTPVVTIQFYKASDGSDVDPASGVAIMFRLTLKASSVE